MRNKAILALLLLIPAPSLGTAFAMIWFPDSIFGQSIFFFFKIWLLILPLIWHVIVDKEKISWSPAQKGGWTTGWLSGFIISLIIAIFFITWGHNLIDFSFFKQKMSDVGLTNPGSYLAGALYWIIINSILEEYIWRWFVVKKAEQIFTPHIAILISALAFTIHHIIAMQMYFSWPTVILCSTGVFIGGAIWSAIYVKYRSIWPGYLSHAIVDLCIFSIGASIIWP